MKKENIIDILKILDSFPENLEALEAPFRVRVEIKSGDYEMLFKIVPRKD